MAEKKPILLFILILFTLSATCASAGMSASKSYKIFVNLPASVSITPSETAREIPQDPPATPGEFTEKIVRAAGHQKILLRTFVIK